MQPQTSFRLIICSYKELSNVVLPYAKSAPNSARTNDL